MVGPVFSFKIMNWAISQVVLVNQKIIDFLFNKDGSQASQLIYPLGISNRVSNLRSPTNLPRDQRLVLHTIQSLNNLKLNTNTQLHQAYLCGFALALYFTQYSAYPF